MIMANGYNSCQFVGNLGADPELWVASNGNQLLKLRLACTESYVDKNNVRQEKTEWVNITLFGKRAEGLAKILNKGDRIFVEGSLHTSSYEKDGVKKYTTEVNVRNVILCGSKRSGEEGAKRPSTAPAAAGENFGDDYPNGDDAIPF